MGGLGKDPRRRGGGSWGFRDQDGRIEGCVRTVVPGRQFRFAARGSPWLLARGVGYPVRARTGQFGAGKADNGKPGGFDPTWQTAAGATAYAVEGRGLGQNLDDAVSMTFLIGNRPSLPGEFTLLQHADPRLVRPTRHTGRQSARPWRSSPVVQRQGYRSLFETWPVLFNRGYPSPKGKHGLVPSTKLRKWRWILLGLTVASRSSPACVGRESG